MQVLGFMLLTLEGFLCHRIDVIFLTLGPCVGETQPPATPDLASHKVLSQWSLVPHHPSD